MRRLLLVMMVAALFVPASQVLAAPVVPTVSTDAASDVAGDSATLHGTVNPEGATGSTTYHFEWRFDTGYGNLTDEVEAYPGDGSTDRDAGRSGELRHWWPKPQHELYHYPVRSDQR